MRRGLGFATLCWLCQPATSQSFDDTAGLTHPWTPGDTVTRMESGDFTGDLYRDLVLQEGPDLVLAFGVGVFQARSPLSSDVIDFCAVPTAFGYDALVASTATGWKKVWIAYPEDPEESSVHVTPQTVTAFEGATSLQALLVGGNTAPQVVALDENGGSILVLPNPFAPTPPSPEQHTLADGPGLALAVVEWDGQAPPEVAVLHDTGLDVYEVDDWTVIDGYDTTAQVSTALVAFQDGGTERLAALIDTGVPKAWICDDTGQAEVALAADEPYELAAADVDGDGTDELLVAHADGTVAGPLLYTCTGTAGPGGSCLFSSYEVLDIGITDLDLQASLPVFDDFTSDGDADLAWFFEEQEELRVAENLDVDHRELFIEVQVVTGTRAQIDWADSAGPLGQMKMAFAAPEEPPPFEPNKILIEEWYQYTPGSLERIGAQAFTVDHPDETGSWGTLHELFFWPSWVPLDGLTHLTIRPVLTDAGGSVVQAGPAALYTIALSDGAGEYMYETWGKTPFPKTERDLTDGTPPSAPPDYPPGTFENSFSGAAGGTHPPKPPPIPDGIPPKAPAVNL